MKVFSAGDFPNADVQSIMDGFTLAAGTGITASTVQPNLIIGSSSAAAVKIAGTVQYKINGILYKKTTAEVAFTAVTMNIPANATLVQEACYMVCLDSSGNATLVMGPISSGVNTALLPERVANLCPIGYVRIAVNAGAPGSGTNFVAGTTVLTDARLVGSVATYVDGYPMNLFGGSAQ